MISEIIKLKNDGLSIKQIATELNIPVGKIQYRWNKHRKEQNEVGSSNVQKKVQTNNQNKKSVAKVRDDHKQTNQCVLMAQSPRTLFCYWKLSSHKINATLHHLNEKCCSLERKIRIYDITAIFFRGDNAHRYQEFSLPINCTDWFFYHLTPNRTYCVDIGVVTKDGNFFPLLRSNPIDTPRSTSYETGLYTNGVSKWKEGRCNEPEWLEGYSSYSYYEKLK